MSPLPIDLLNIITELVWLDASEQRKTRKRSISSYTLACKEFASHAQPLLFQDLILRTLDCSTDLQKMLQHKPFLKSAIQSIALSPNYNGTQAVFECLSSDLIDQLIPNLDLTIAYLVLDDQWTAVTHTYAQTRLTLRSSLISSEAAFRRLLSWFPHLQDLQLISNHFTWQPEPPRQIQTGPTAEMELPRPVLSRPLRSLVLSGALASEFIPPWFVKSQIGHGLESMSVDQGQGQVNMEIGKQLIIHHGHSLKHLIITSPPNFNTKHWSLANCVNLESLSISLANTHRDLPWIVYQLRMLPKRNALRRIEIGVNLYTDDFDRTKLRERAWPPALTNMDTLIASWDLPGVQQIAWTIHCGRAQQNAMPHDRDFVVIMPKSYARGMIQPIQYSMW